MENKKNTKNRKSIKRFLKRLIFKLASLRVVSDKSNIRIIFRLSVGKKINLKDPKTFNEKLNWMKLYFRKPIMTTMVDKYEVKDYVTSRIGSEYVVPLIGVYDSWDEIDFSKLKTPFVIKATHSSGVVKVIKDLESVDLNELKVIFDKALKRNYYYWCREWPYKNVKPRIIIEEFIEDSREKNLPVYKFFCFDGEPYLVQTIKNDKTSYETIDYFDMDWKFLDLKQNFNNSDIPLDKPSNFEEMKTLAAKLSQGFPFVRVDLYSVNEKIYFSEFTFFSDAGFEKFTPDYWDLKLGNMINLKKYGK